MVEEAETLEAGEAEDVDEEEGAHGVVGEETVVASAYPCEDMESFRNLKVLYLVK